MFIADAGHTHIRVIEEHQEHENALNRSSANTGEYYESYDLSFPIIRYWTLEGRFDTNQSNTEFDSKTQPFYALASSI